MRTYLDKNTDKDYSESTGIEVKQFSKKQQVKVFISLNDWPKQQAKTLFTKLYKANEMPIYDHDGAMKFKRKMRAYLIKDEATMEKLANDKFQEDLKKKQAQINTSNVISGQSSKGAISSIEAHSNSFGSMMCGLQSFLGRKVDAKKDINNTFLNSTSLRDATHIDINVEIDADIKLD